MKGRTPALQQNRQSSEKSQHFKEKNTIFNEQHVCLKLYNQGRRNSALSMFKKIISRNSGAAQWIEVF